MKKRLIALMVAGLVATATLSGCAEMEEVSGIDINQKISGKYAKESARITDVYISIEEQPNERTLHKGDIIYYNNGSGRLSTSIDLTRMQFDCGKELISNATYFLSEDMHEEGMYDKICADCFNQ